MNPIHFPHIADFLKNVLPFNLLEDNDRCKIVSQAEIAFFPRKETLIEMGEKPKGWLFVIQKGAVRITITEDSGSEMLVDIRGEGEVFGATSLLKGKESLFTITAQEDLLVLMIPESTVYWAMETNCQFHRFLEASLARDFRAIKQSAEEQLALFDKGSQFDIDMFLTRKKVKDIMERNVLFCNPETRIRDAARQMKARDVSSIVVCQKEQLAGIVTDSDLRNQVLAGNFSPDNSVSAIMSSPPKTISTEASTFAALLLMSQYGISQVIVTEDRRMMGVVSDHDLQMEMGSSPIGLVGSIEKCTSLESLVKLRPHIDRILREMARRSDSVKPMVDLISQINDRVTRQMVHLVEQQMWKEGWGPPPFPYCWLTMGSEGRGEQTLNTDQDNGIMYADGPKEEKQNSKPWFLELAGRVVDALVRFGIPRCSGGIMASNPEWCRSVGDWEERFTDWIITSDPYAVKMATICFDLRCLQEEFHQADQIRGLICHHASRSMGFLRRLAKHALRNRPPLSFFRQFVVEREGAHKNELNLKLKGMAPIVDAVRVMALEIGSTKTNTLDRLQAVEAEGLIDTRFCSEIQDAYDYINSIRISYHLKPNKTAQLPTNYVDPGLLNTIQKNMLKESFAVVRRFQEMVETRYQTRLIPDSL